jgi:rRNA maturation endonuclease Nob1
MLGPIDYIVVGFKGNNFDGSVLEELVKASESEAIRVVDLLFVIKDADGNVAMAEIEDQDDELKEVAKAIGHDGDLPLLTEEDVEKLGAAMENDSSAGVLVIEQLWAKGLKSALINAGAELIDEGRIHTDVVEAAVEEIESL